jgi:hypothetical protein
MAEGLRYVDNKKGKSLKDKSNWRKLKRLVEG